MAFYEVRQYIVKPGKMDAWVKMMDEEIIPFQVAQGMVISGSFRGEEDDSVYIWLRRFENEEECKRLYEAVYGSDHWKNNLSDRLGEMIDRDNLSVQRVCATAVSVLK